MDPFPVWDAEEAKRQLWTLGRQNGDELMEPPAQGHGESHQEEGAVGLTPEQYSGLWTQLHLGGMVVSGSTRDPSDL